MREGRDKTAASWGFQNVQSWAAGELTAKSLARLEQCMALSPFPQGLQSHQEPPHPIGLWRIGASVASGDAPMVASLTYGTGVASMMVTEVLLPLVAFVPGYAALSVRPLAEPQAALSAQCSVTPVQGYGQQLLAVLVDAQAAPQVLPAQAVAFTAWAASTYTPTGAPAPIAVAAGATVDVAGRVVLATGVGVARLEL